MAKDLIVPTDREAWFKAVELAVMAPVTGGPRRVDIEAVAFQAREVYTLLTTGKTAHEH